MTVFVLVSGTYTGGWIWEDVAARLRAEGAVAHEVTLTGMGDRRHLGGPGTGLDTHVEDLVQLIDHVEAQDLVMVGHCYGIAPVLGAAGRRADRIRRIVYLDAPMPQDGFSLAEQIATDMPDPELRDQLLGQIGRAGEDGMMPAPSLAQWRAWGSLDGLSEKALERLHRLSAPQPVATYTQKARLTGAVAEIPTSGIFCSSNGMSIAGVEALVASGHPRFQPLADPRVGFFEIATGHYPMLSAPDELAELLVRAAAGQGHRVTAA
ncbi:alpha/beta fold hydrolase [Streptomyces sp. NPDC058739]|uniref:alpha/beta fold hydrolase n=1 Tax=Streptomyces sp. NPDC058739 TaxID=3346618 RepID=UPI0036A5A4CC